MRLGIKEHLVFPFADPSWMKKTLIGLVYYILGLTGPILFGYQLSVIREAVNGEDDQLPEFENLGKLWKQGFFICALLGGFYMVSMLTVMGVVMASSGGRPGDWVFVVFFGSYLVIVGTLFFFYPAMALRYALTEQVGSMLQFRTLLSDIRQGTTDYLAIVFFPIVFLVVSVFVAACTAGVGMFLLFPATVLAMMVQGRMIGSYYRLYFQ